MAERKKTRFMLPVFFIFLIGAGAVLVVVVSWFSKLELPDLGSFENRKIIQSTKIYDRTGKILLWDIHENIQRTVVPFDQISRHIKNATVAIEDSSFYQHKGIDVKAIARAILKDILSGDTKQGASTISQQLVKNTLLTQEKTFTRKIKEIILTVKLEKILPKEKILELYLNEISYGGNSYGIEAVSQNFFGKPARNLTLTESAYLAAIPKAPTYYSPYGNHKKELEARKNMILSRMLELGFITEKEKDSAEKEMVKFFNKSDSSIKAPHFSVFTRSYLEEKYGEDATENGLKVITTLDYDLQKTGEELVAKYAKENKEKFNASNAALVAIDPKTGQILTMVGSKDYFNQEEEGNFNVAIAHRQPGSSIKPFIYATAFKKGYTPNTVLFDVPTEFNPSCNPDGSAPPNIPKDHCYKPENYDNQYRGPVVLRNALAQSINVPSVKTLYLASLKDSLTTAKDMGITSLNDPDRYGLTLVLGGGEVSPLEMTGAYSVFANNGIRNPITGILKIEDRNGKVLEQFYSKPAEALEKNIALIVTDVLSDNNARTPAFGATSPLYFTERPTAAKTGTTNNYRDAWVMGYAPNIAVGVWCGNNDNTPMEKKVAGFIAAPLWHAFMEEVFKKLPVENFEKPEIPKREQPMLSGVWQIPDSTTIPPTTRIHSILYWINKNDPLGPAPTDPASDYQFSHWEYSVQKWKAENGYQ